MKRPDYKRAVIELRKILDEVEERKGEEGKAAKRKGQIVDVTEETVGTVYQFTDLDLTVYQNSPDKNDTDETKHFHSLRHTYAVRRIVENVPVYKVQKMMGHSSVVTTEIYFKLDLKRLKRDFPTINTGYYEPVKSVFRDTNIRDTINKNYAIVESEMTN